MSIFLPEEPLSDEDRAALKRAGAGLTCALQIGYMRWAMLAMAIGFTHLYALLRSTSAAGNNAA
jgi:hypothetical protein